MPDEIKLVLFDMDNVLCEYDRGRRVAFLAELAGTTSEFVYKAIWESGLELLGDSGTLDALPTICGDLASASAIPCRSMSGWRHAAVR